MKKSNVIEINRPAEICNDPLTELIRSGARKILEEALESEINLFIDSFKALKTEKGMQRVIRNGYLPEREITTGIGNVPVKAPRLRDLEKGRDGEKIRFSSSILPVYLRKTKCIEEFIPWLYLKGVSAGDFSEVLASLVGADAKGFSQPVVSRLKSKWKQEFEAWGKRDLSKKRYAYIWVDGIYCNVRMDDKQCLLVVMGATAKGKKKLIAVEGGYRESCQSWREILLSLKERGLTIDPEVAIGDGALGFWKAVAEIFPKTRCQRCWVHKTANILNKLPKASQPKAKGKIHEIWMSETKEDAKKAFNHFIKLYEAKYPKATNCLEKDREVLLTFYDFPAEHWKHLRTTNPIESTFATVRLRTAKVRGCFSADSVISMAFKLCQSAEKKWRCLSAPKRLVEVIEGVKFVNGVAEFKKAA